MMLTVLSLKNAQESESHWRSLQSSKSLHITDRIDELRPEDFRGLEHIEHLMIGPQLEEIHAESVGFRPAGRRRLNKVQISPRLFCALRSLRQLQINMKGLTELRKDCFAGLPYLESLDLSGNRISTIHRDAFRGLGNLKILCLDHNRLTEIEAPYFSPLSFLSFLRLDANRITQMASRAFIGTPFLISLNLQHNRISDIHPSTFAGLRSLSNLDLNENPLSGEDLKFIHNLGSSKRISIQTRRGTLILPKASLFRAK